MHGPPILFFFFPMLIPAAAVVFFGWLGLRFVRAKEQANALARPGAPPAELARIEESLEMLQRDVQALQERQGFMEKLLERPREAAGPAVPRAPADPHL